MVSTLYTAPTKNFVQKNLNGAITNIATTITLKDTTNMQSPGYIVIDRTDSAGNVTPTLREVITYTGITANSLTGCIRGADGDNALAHNDGAVVEQTFTEGMWNSLVTIVATALDGNGLLNAINSPVSISNLNISGSLNVAGASLVGVGIFPTFQFVGTISGPTTLIQTPLSMPKAGTFKWFSVMTRTQASTASVIIDVNVNGNSVFSSATRPLIALGGTYVSTASILTANFNSGDRLSWDFKNGFITDFVVQGGTT